MLSKKLLKSIEYFANCRIFVSSPLKDYDQKESSLSKLNMLVTKSNGFSYHENYQMSIKGLGNNEPVFKFEKVKENE